MENPSVQTSVPRLNAASSLGLAGITGWMSELRKDGETGRMGAGRGGEGEEGLWLT